MTSKITVERLPAGAAMLTFEDRNGFVGVEYLTADQVEELVSKLRSTWIEPADPAAKLYQLYDDTDNTCHGTFDTLDEAKAAAAYDHLKAWTVYHAGEIAEIVSPLQYPQAWEPEPFTSYSTHNGRDVEGAI